VVLSEKPEIGEDNGGLDPALLDDLIAQIGSLASIYHKPAEAFIMKSMTAATTGGDEDGEEGDYDQKVPTMMTAALRLVSPPKTLV
jgi:AP-1 complex subunit beta-1